MVSPLWWTAVHLFSLGQTPSRRKTTSVCSEWQTRRTWVCSVTCLMSPQHLFTGCVSSDVSDDHLTLSQRLRLFTHSWPPALTSTTPYLLSVTDTLQHVIQILHDDLHWLDVADRVTYKLGVIMHRCLHGKALQYLVDCCTPVNDVVGRQRLRSATQQLMVAPRHRLSTVGRQAFTVHGPMVWNSLPDDLRAQQTESFTQGLKTWLFSRY